MEDLIWQLLGLGIGQGQFITSRLDAVDKIRMIRALGESALTEPQWHSLSETMARIDMLFCALDRRAADVVPPSAGFGPLLMKQSASPLSNSQTLAIMLVFTVAIVLTLGRGMAPRCAVT
jgi:hypothetical protein